MADTRYAPLKIVELGLTTAYTSGIIVGTTDFVMKNDGRTMLHVKKSGAGVCSMIIKTVQKVRSFDVAENTISIPASTGDVLIGPFPGPTYNDGNGDMRFNFSEVTGLTFLGAAM